MIKIVKIFLCFQSFLTINRTVTIQAPINEFMGTIEILQSSIRAIGEVILLIALVVVYLVAGNLVKPIKNNYCSQRYCSRKWGFNSSSSS